MSWSLRCPENQVLPIPVNDEKVVGTARDCDLRLRGEGLPTRVGVIFRSSAGDAWVRVQSVEPPVALNGRPVRALACLYPGDRLCFGAFCVDLVGEPLRDRTPTRPVDAFGLRARGGAGSGALHPGPLVHLDALGDVVSAAAGVVAVALGEGEVHVRPGPCELRVNGHPIDDPVRLRDQDQVHIGRRRYLVELLTLPPPDVDTERLAAVPSMGAGTEPDSPARAPGANLGGLWWLIVMAALVAVSVSALLYYHG